MSIKGVTKNMTLDRAEWRQRIYTINPNKYVEDPYPTPKF